MRIVFALSVVCAPSLCQAASLVVEVLGPGGSPVAEAVVYAIPQGRTAPAPTREAVMDQRERTFVPHVLAVQVGTAVRFPNSDNVRHQVYSFSRAKKFQLPLYEGTPATPVVFDKPGVVALGCNIHDRMSAYIVVVDTPFFGLVRRGRAELAELPAGVYSVRVWYPGMRQEPDPQPLSLAASERRELKFSTRN